MITHLLDSDWLADYLKGKAIARGLLTPLVEQGRLATSIIVYAEIYEGPLGTATKESYFSVLADLVAGVPVLSPDQETGQIFAQCRATLRQQGQLILDHDLWIGATALRYGLILVTRNTKDFRRIPGIRLQRQS